jgi:hypothetical protein
LSATIFKDSEKKLGLKNSKVLAIIKKQLSNYQGRFMKKLSLKKIKKSLKGKRFNCCD